MRATRSMTHLPVPGQGTVDDFTTRMRRDRLRKLAAMQRDLQAMTVIGPAMTPDQVELVRTAQTAVMDVELAVADEGHSEMVS